VKRIGKNTTGTRSLSSDEETKKKNILKVLVNYAEPDLFSRGDHLVLPCTQNKTLKTNLPRKFYSHPFQNQSVVVTRVLL
jgi:hypothetical protein